MKLSIVMPVYNERATVLELINRVLNTPHEKELIVVDDASTDGTRELLAKLSDTRVRVFIHERNRGKGAALRTGFKHVSGDIVIIQDADLEYNPQEYPKLLAPILDGRADVVYGSRFLGGDARRVLYFWHYMGNKFLTLMSNMFTNLNLSDMETGYKVFKKEIATRIRIQENRFGFEPEVTAKIARLGCRIYEVGVSYSGRTYKEGKKINWRDGVMAIWCIFKYGMYGGKTGDDFKKVQQSLE
jgi:glycosyltransferase involved in cell wall biosynthesis